MSVRPSSCQALAITGPGRVALVRVPLPELRADQLLVQVSACGICGSDLRPYRSGQSDLPFFGHEFSGTVVAAGAELQDFSVGDRVAAGLSRGCGRCQPCLRGLPHFCQQAQGQFQPGGFADLCLVTCAGGFRPVAKIPAALDHVTAALFEPVACAMRIASRIPAVPGSRVLVIGLGMMGMLSGLLLRRAAPEVAVVGADNHAGRVALGRALGLGTCVLLEPGGGGLADVPADFDVVVDATGIAAVFPMALDLARLGGTVVLAGVPVDAVALSPLPIFRKELTVVGAKGPFPYPNGEGGSRALDLLLTADIRWGDLVTVFPFHQAALAFQRAANGDSLKTILHLGES
jgi:threonine dehydrogenase-like Zn-dependent dehydrogenase